MSRSGHKRRWKTDFRSTDLLETIAKIPAWTEFKEGKQPSSILSISNSPFFSSLHIYPWNINSPIVYIIGTGSFSSISSSVVWKFETSAAVSLSTSTYYRFRLPCFHRSLLKNNTLLFPSSFIHGCEVRPRAQGERCGVRRCWLSLLVNWLAIYMSRVCSSTIKAINFLCCQLGWSKDESGLLTSTRFLALIFPRVNQLLVQTDWQKEE